MKPALALLLGLCAAAAHADVTIKPADVQRLGIVAAALAPATNGDVRPRSASVQVLDSTPFVTLVGDRAVAVAAAQASAADARRTTELAATGDIARRLAEVARATAAADRARVATFDARFAAEYSPALHGGAPGMTDAVSRGRARLVRVEGIAGPVPRAGTLLRLRLADGTALRTRARVLGPATGASLAIGGPALLCLVVDVSLHTGEALTAELPPLAGASGGALVPQAAVVYASGRAWVWRVAGGDRFVRVALPAGATPVPGGFRAALMPGTRVVVRGAGALLAAEAAALIPAAPAAGDGD